MPPCKQGGRGCARSGGEADPMATGSMALPADAELLEVFLPLRPLPPDGSPPPAPWQGQQARAFAYTQLLRPDVAPALAIELHGGPGDRPRRPELTASFPLD